MSVSRKYQGEIEWHTGEPDKSGIYLTSHNGFVCEMKFYKHTGKSWWETYDESEEGGFQKISSVQAWGYLPKPYCE